jgi:hypothetical protein
MFLFVNLFISVSAEISLWNNVLIDEDESVVKQHAFYTMEDTSSRGIGANKDTPIYVWYNVEALPYDLNSYNPNYNGVIDWCNLTIRHYKHTYGTDFFAFSGSYGGSLLNTTTETQSVYFANTSQTSDTILINLRDRDSLNIDMSCHYTDSNYLYVESVLIGGFTTYSSSFECDTCTQYSLEELSHQTEKEEEITLNEVAVYDNIQTMIDWNFQIWLIMSWIIKIGMVLVAVFLIFAGGYYFYVFLKDIANNI